MNYGVPYQGSKSRIAKRLIDIMPAGRRFVDLFAGGCAMTHAAILSNKYNCFLANDLQGFGLRLFMGAINGHYNDCTRQWVTRDQFHKLKNIEPFVSLCWSFSNCQRSYVYAKSKEEIARQACIELNNGARRSDIVSRLGKCPDSYTRSVRVSGLFSLRDKCKGRIKATYKSYTDYAHALGDVVYCDPPYANTTGYFGSAFDNVAFWEWCRTRDYPVYVSEYNAPPDFASIGACYRRESSTGKASRKIVTEFLFCHKRFANNLLLVCD